MSIEQYIDRHKNKQHSSKILRLKNDSINKKCNLNKAINITKYFYNSKF